MILNEDFFGRKQEPRTRIENDNEQKKEPPMSKEDREAMNKFFGKDLASLLGQGTIKKTPKMNKERLKKQKNNEPLSEEMKKEIIELFGEKYDEINIY